MLTPEAPGTVHGRERVDSAGAVVAADPLAAAELSRDALAAPAMLARLFGDWEEASGILLAVSGGPDSVALMLLAARWARLRPTPPRLSIATVDHGLRPSSRDEASAVAAWARALGLSHATLTWQGPKPKTRIQETARANRYALLCAHARAIDAEVVATAHHADDQAETILFRLLRGSGLAGLRGMARSRVHDGIVISRPLLDCAKADLVAICRASGHSFFEDPSNANPAFARTRIREILATLESAGSSRHVLAGLGRRATRAEAALDAIARKVSAGLEADRTEGRFVCDMRCLANEPDEIVLRVLAREISAVNGRRGIRLDRLETLATRFRKALESGTRLTASLAGTLVVLGRDGTLTLCRETERRRGTQVRSTLREAGARPHDGKSSLGKHRDAPYITQLAGWPPVARNE